MILDAYYKMLSTLYTNQVQTAAVKNGNGVDKNLGTFSTSYMSYFNTNASFSSPKLITNDAPGAYNNDAGGFAFGTGTTAAAASDYKLANIITSGLSISGSSRAADGTFSILLTNTTADAITISECGYYGKLPDKVSSPSYTDFNYVLIERTVLDSPVTIPAGDTYAVKFKASITLPT